MAIAEKIQHYLQKLPTAFQIEVLDFVEYLLAKAERQDERDWSDLSLALAMRGMEDEDAPKLRSLRHEAVDGAVMLHRETSPAVLPAASYPPVRHGQR